MLCDGFRNYGHYPVKRRSLEVVSLYEMLSSSMAWGFVAKATRIMTKKLGRDPTDEEVARKAKTLATKAAKAAEGVIKINPAFVE